MPTRTAGSYRVEEILPSAARTTAGDSGWYTGYADSLYLGLLLEVTARSGTTPTLDIAIEHSLDGGTTGLQIARFVQVTSAQTLPYREYVEIGPQIATAASAAVTPVTGGTAYNRAGQNANFADAIRLRWPLPGGTTPSFTFRVLALSQSPLS